MEKIKRIVYGAPGLEEIETTNVENFNGILREKIGRLVRKSKCFSKRKDRTENAIELLEFYWNFMNSYQRETSPAMLEGITDKIGNWHEFFYFQLTIFN